jgi:diguanylate cyclase (GGDEF)-like protein
MPKQRIDLPDSLQRQLKSCRTLPSVPSVVVRILELSHDEEVVIGEIARVLGRDPALAAKLLRVSNSAFYGVRYEVTTVERAISILGINASLSVALSFSLVKTLRKSGVNRFDHAAYWRRSAIAAAAGRALAGPADKNAREELFLSGLLQDVGMLALNEAIPQGYGPVTSAAKGSHQKLVEIERERLGADHSTVGAWLLEHWKLPEKFQLAVAASHDRAIAADSEHVGFCRATAVAGDIAEIWTDPTTAVSVAQNSAIDLLKMSPETFERLLSEVAAAIPEVTSEFDLNVGGEEMVNRLLEQARETLVTLSMQAQQQVQKIRDLSRHDRLTSVYNRSYLEEELPLQFEAASESGQSLSVLFIDIDHFKKVNDTHGHEAGDTVLVSVAGTMRTVVRASDIIARYGGEEFVCLMPNTGAQEAAAVAERLRRTIESRSQTNEEDPEIRITVSLGCATHSAGHPFQDSKQLLRKADRCLYRAKESGRNRLVTMDSLKEDSDVEGCA